MNKSFGNSFLVRFTFFLLALILFFYSIIKAKDFLYPIAIAVLIAYLLYPLTNFLEKKRFPRIIAILLSIVFAFVIMGGTSFFIYRRLKNLISDFPALKRQAISNIEALQVWIEELFSFQDESITLFVKHKVSEIFESGDIILNTIFTSTTETIFSILILPVYVFAFLFYRTKFAYFILMKVKSEKKYITIKILRDISQIASKYMGGVMIVVFILSIINSLGLIIIGLPYPIVLGVVSALFALIPYFGSILGGAAITLFALLTADSPTIALKVFIFYVGVMFTEHNILTPNIVGGNVRINAFVIIISLIVASMIWGIPGMLVIVPFIAVLKIISKHYPGLQSYAFLLGTRGARRHAIHIPNISEWFKRKKKVD